MSQTEQPLIAHLVELRTRLLHALGAILLVFVCLVYFSNDIYKFVSEPLISQLPAGTSMIATDVATPFLTPIKLTIVVAFFITIPYLLYQAWAFIAPGLYKHERRLIMPLVCSSALLFYSGMAFAYYVVFPLVFGFFTSTAPAGVTIATDIANYLDFVLTLFFAFGVAFEIPVATILLCWTGVTTPESLKAKRPYVVVTVFVIGMLLTPPDVFSQTLLAIPMWMLFEVGVFFARFYTRKEPLADEETEEGG
ncbi:twin-arginine translocase subunit TatC [Aeromonas rivuli]|jgi:sec-independent protein translocase protein TatC|uniref:twin-arginine translocase subunit TatC n=1 Tax=Aeromonas TaxID=642 RepID=UPI0005A83A60|nr:MULTISPECIES: twin-arginine translocase subunit TatC [Aeromonas]MCS3457818.1 sec-independent protein translocase protein TatC [Aeromonas sp. BIGb0405]MCS3461876.1 sec-independent protein translocase protein TatC [Aeromonas sp. BIGb0445]UBO74000.1 twin-arginine translocase subunit TatC [Aeromonas rivuli]